MPETSPEIVDPHEALGDGAGLVDCSDRTQIEVFGADRASFLHNLCTNTIRNLAPGSGCEAFLLNAKGHIVGHGFLLAGEQSIVIETAPGQAEFLMAHLDRYLIREDVRLENRTSEWSEMLLAGAKAESLLQQQGTTVPTQRLDHTASSIAGQEVWVRRIDLAGPNCFLIACQRESHEIVAKELIALGAAPCRRGAFNCPRIEHGMPLFGTDITDANLPQEVDRNSEAISFTKGCYLGQETVARIDALGHVNRLLRRVRCGSPRSFLVAAQEFPAVGEKFFSGEQPVGQITSLCWSPQFSAPLALAYLRRGFHEPGTLLQCQGEPAEVLS